MNKYEEYQNKIHNRAKILRVVYLLRFLICGIIIALIATFFTLTSIKGMIVENKELNKVYTYGDTITPEASGFLNDDIYYEYSILNDDNWSEETPRKPGYYQMRAYSKNTYGVKMTSSIQEFQIVPIQATIKVSEDFVNYKDTPKITYNLDGSDKVDTLFSQDRVSNYDVIYEDISKDTTQVKVDLDKLTVIDSDGEDVTDCYSFTNLSTEITIKQVPLTISLKGNSDSKIYDGNPLIVGETKNVVEGLKEGDIIATLPTSEDSIIDVGTTEIKPKEGYSLSIINSEGIDVTTHYSVKYEYGSFEIKKRDITIEVSDLSYQYDGEEHKYPVPVLNSNTTLGDGDRLIINNFSETKTESFVGSYSQEYGIDIYNEQRGKSTIDNYNITYIRYDVNGRRYVNDKTSKITITQRPLTIKASEATFYYSDQLKNININQFTTEGLIEKDKLTITCDIDEDSIKEGSHNSTRQYTIDIVRDDGTSVKNNYSITRFNGLELDTSSLTFTKRQNRVVFSDQSIVYDGKEHSPSNVEDENYTITKDLLTGDIIKTTIDDVSSTEVSSKKYGKARIYRSDEDITKLYDLDVVQGTFEITKRPITISIYGDKGENSKTITNKIYDKSSFEFYFEEVESEDVNEGLVATHTISMKCSDRIKKSTVGTFTADEDDFTITIKDSNGNVVTSNYEITKVLDWENDFDIEKKDVSLTFKNVEKWYDGEMFKLDQLIDTDLNYYEYDGLLSGDYIQITGVNSFKDPGTYSLNNVVPIEKIRIKDMNGNDVTDNYAITTNLNDVTLTIKQIKIVYNVSGNDTIYNGQTITYSSDTSVETETEKTLNLSSTTIMPESGDDFYNTASFTITASGKEVSTLKYKKNDLTFKTKKTYLKDITIDKVDFSDSIETDVNITKRPIKINIDDYTYWWHHSSDFNPDYIADKLLTIEDTVNGGLVTGHYIKFEWNDNVSGVHDVGTYSFKDDFKLTIHDENNKDVTENYDIDVASNFGSLTIKKMKIDLTWNGSKPSNSATFDNYEHSYYVPGICSIASSSDCPDLDEVRLSSGFTEQKRDVLFDSEGNVIAYDLSIISASIIWNDNASVTYSWEPNGLNNDFDINNVEEMKPEITINKRPAAYSIQFEDGSTSKTVMYTKRSVELNNKSINSNKNSTQYIRYLLTDTGSTVDGVTYELPYGCEFVLERNDLTLPNNVGTYNMMDYYDVKVVDTYRKDSNGNYLDITDNFDLIDKPTLTLTIEKIKITISASIDSDDNSITYGEKPKINYSSSGNVYAGRISYEQPSEEVFDNLTTGDNDVDISPSKVTYTSDDDYKYELEKDNEWTCEKVTITEKPITPSSPSSPTKSTPKVYLYAVPEFTYDFADFYDDKLIGVTSWLNEGDTLSVTSSLSFSYSSEDTEVKGSDLTFKITNSEGEDITSSKYDLSNYTGDTVLFEVVMLKNNELTATIENNTYSTIYSGEQVSEDKLTSYFDPKNNNYGKFMVYGADNMEINNITFILNDEDEALKDAGYQIGKVGTYNRTIKSFSCDIEIQPRIEYDYGDGSGESKDFGKEKKKFKFNSDDENPYFKLTESSFDGNIVVEITKASLILIAPSNDMNVKIRKNKNGYSYYSNDTKVSTVVDPNCYMIGGDGIEKKKFTITFFKSSFSETETTSDGYWKYVDWKNTKITDSKGNDVSCCFEISKEGSSTIYFTLQKGGKW